MPELKIRIGRVGDPPLFPELAARLVGRLEFVGAGVLEGGMASGRTSVGFMLADENGNVYLAETSAALVDCLDAAIKGAEIRWAREEKKN